MGQILVRDLDDAVIARLESRAAREAISVEQVARQILSASMPLTREEALAEMDRIRARQPKSHVDTTALIRAWRDLGDDADY